LARIPAVQEKLRLPVGILGAVLLSAAAGALVAMPVTSRLVGRFGSARLTQLTAGLLCGAIILPPLAWTAPTLALFLFVYGAAAGSMDVAMNTQAVTVEAASGRRVMVGFHALFSFGGMIGALMGSAAARYGIEPALNLACVGVMMAALAAIASRNLIPDRRDRVTGSQSARELLLPLIGLGVVAFCILVGEGAMADWSAVYLNQLAGPAVAPLGYAVFSLTMAIGRLGGDWLHEHLGPVSTVRWGSGLAAIGLGGALSAGNVAAALIGFACVGIGFSAIFPIVCSVAGSKAGNRPQAGIAAVTMTGYLGFLIGPPVIGFLAQASSLRLALGLVAILSGLTSALAGSVRPRGRDRI
jgi:MFS family permease